MSPNDLPTRRHRPRAPASTPNNPSVSARSIVGPTLAGKLRSEVRPAGTQSIETAMQVLLALADIEQPIGVTEIAKRLGLHKSMVSRQLAMLKVADFVSQDRATSRYALGLGLLPLAAKVLSTHRLSGAAAFRLEALARSTRETVTVSGWDGTNAINLDHFGRTGAKRRLAPPGRLNPAHCTATGKAFLAELSGDALAKRLNGSLERYTDRTITDPSRLSVEIDAIRRTQLALNRGEFIDGTDAIATLVRPRNGARPYGIAITLSSRRGDPIRLDELGRELLRAARDLSDEV